MPNITRDIPKNSKLHKKLVKMIESRVSLSKRHRSTAEAQWRNAEKLMCAYVPVSEEDNVRNSRRRSGQPEYTTIQIPYTMAMVMSAHTYWTSVFFARNPVHQFSGRHGEGEMQIQAVEALMDYQMRVGGMLAPYYLWFYDAGKYGVGILGTYWGEELIQYGQISDGPNGKVYTSLRTKGYTGNKAYNISPWDFYSDPRFTIAQFQQGEYCYVRRRLGWNEIIRRKTLGYYMNVDELKGHISERADEGFLERPQDLQHNLFDHEERGHPAVVPIFEFYVDLIPKEWELGTSDFPEKWVFSITSDLATIIGAQPLGLAHGQFPFDVLESEIEAYGVYNRGIPEVLEPIQQTMDWLFNSHFYNVRAALNNQFIIDPSRVFVKDVEKGGAGFVWRLKPEAYGTDIRTIVHQIPVQDFTRSHLTDIDRVQGLGEKILGINDAMMGVSSGGRKTAGEIRTTTAFGTGRLKTVAEYMSASSFAPHSMRMVQTSQQYYDAQMKLRIVGDLAMTAGQKFMQVDQGSIAGFYDFVPIDGTLPADRMAQAMLWKDLMANMRNMPELAQQYDIGRIFAWVAQLGGLKNINQFKLNVQPVPDNRLMADAANGKVVPITGPGRDPATQLGLPQIGGSLSA